MLKMKRKKKYRLRPWVKVALTFVIGVSIIANIFQVVGALASDGKEKEEKNQYTTVHGVIEMNLNGESYIKPIDGAWDKEIIVETKEDYLPLGIYLL
jgi:hypothetical protein